MHAVALAVAPVDICPARHRSVRGEAILLALVAVEEAVRPQPMESPAQRLLSTDKLRLVVELAAAPSQEAALVVAVVAREAILM